MKKRFKNNLSIIKQALNGMAKGLKPQPLIPVAIIDYKIASANICAIHEADASDDAVYSVLHSVSEPWDYLSTRSDILSEEHRQRARQLAMLGQALAYDIALRDANGTCRNVTAQKCA